MNRSLIENPSAGIPKDGQALQKKLEKERKELELEMRRRQDDAMQRQMQQAPKKMQSELDRVQQEKEDKLFIKAAKSRQQKAVGSLISKAVSKVFKKDGKVSEMEKLLSTPNEDAIYFSKDDLAKLKKENPEDYAEMLSEFAIVREVDDELIEKAKKLGYSKEQIKSVLEGGNKAIKKVRTEFDSLERNKKADGGSMLMPPEMPVDTYTPEEQANAEATQLPDSEMEDRYMDFMLDESLGEEEQDYLMNALESDPKLSEIFDKVIMTASEFSGAGEVEGPGTGVSDSIPARLSDGEFVITRKATDELGADNLQKMMDQAEREADSEGGMLRKAIGGLLEDPMQSEKDMGQRDVTDEEINKSMLSANRMPSLQPSRLR